MASLRHLQMTLILPACLMAASACGSSGPGEKRVEPVYDQTSGKLQLLKLDSNGDGRIDTWSFMDGTRVVRIEIDENGDSTIDRWEHYGADESISRIDVSRKRDGKADRIEFYERGATVRAEEDTDGDGKIDKWETYDGPRLASVAFDTMHRGSPDRRLVYAADGSARVEIIPASDARR